MFLSDKQIKDYQDDGVIIIKEIFKDWIEPLRKGFQKVLKNPSQHLSLIHISEPTRRS